MKPGMVSAVRIPVSISWPQRRGSIGEQRISEATARVRRREVILDIVGGGVVDVRFEGLEDLLSKGS